MKVSKLVVQNVLLLKIRLKYANIWRVNIYVGQIRDRLKTLHLENMQKCGSKLVVAMKMCCCSKQNDNMQLPCSNCGVT